MNVGLQKLLTDAEALPSSEQDRLAEMLEAWLDARNDPPDITDDELAQLRRLDAEPFEAAPDAVRAEMQVAFAAPETDYAALTVDAMLARAAVRGTK
jgi:hypothetical protein